MPNSDWLPQNHEALHDKAQQTNNYLIDPMNRDRLGFGPMTPYGQWFDMDFTPKFSAFSTAFADWFNPAERTPLKTDALAEAEKVFVPCYRQLYTGMLKGNPLVTDVDLEAMGLPKHSSGHHTDAPVATTYPDFDIDSGTIRRLTIHFYDQGSKTSKAKPKGQHGAEAKWGILPAPPTSVTDLVNSAFDTHTPLTLEFDESQRGSTVYFCLRWENTTGQKGPWGEIQSAIIP
jgi:hypothetical protein